MENQRIEKSEKRQVRKKEDGAIKGLVRKKEKNE